MSRETVVVNGFTLAPLRVRQIRSFFTLPLPTSTDERFEQNLQVVAASLVNAGRKDATADSLGDELTLRELHELHAAVVEITGLKAADPGESVATVETGSDSSTVA